MLEKRTRKNSRRKTQGEPINARIFVSAGHYNDRFLRLYKKVRGGEPEYDISDGMLDDDRRVLNVKLRPGRPLGSRTRPITER